MRASLNLTFIALLSSVVYGFSSPMQSSVRPHAILDTRPTAKSTATQPSLLHRMPARGGARASSSSSVNGEGKYPAKGVGSVVASLYGTLGVLYILAKAVKRVVPIAMEPFSKGAIPLNRFELGSYITMCLWFAYVEGYKGFQLKFSPLVVKRSFTLIPGQNGTRWYHFLLAPLYSMGMIHATRKRKIVSWSVTTGVALIVAAVKRLPYPWRNIVDAGVVAGLTWGSLSIAILYLKAWVSGSADPATDAALPESVKGA